MILNKVTTKLCKKCNTHLELSSRHFYKDKSHITGYHATCKGCCKLYLRSYRKHRDFKAQSSLYNQKYYEKQKEKLKAYQRDYYLKNKEKIISRCTAYNRKRRHELKELTYKQWTENYDEYRNE